MLHSDIKNLSESGSPKASDLSPCRHGYQVSRDINGAQTWVCDGCGNVVERNTTISVVRIMGD